MEWRFGVDYIRTKLVGTRKTLEEVADVGFSIG
jgi:hypothetical protein